jgi:tRNA-intron endonuclease
MIQAKLSGEKIYSNSSDAFSLYEKSSFGEKREGRVEYAPAEALFLLSERKMKIFSGKKALDKDDMLKKIKKHDKKIEIKSTAFNDLRRRGYILKTGLKFGAEFRVYDKGSRPSSEHAKWLLFVVKANEQISWHEFAAKARIAHSTKKALLIGIVDDEGSVSYYESSWMRP